MLKKDSHQKKAQENLEALEKSGLLDRREFLSLSSMVAAGVMVSEFFTAERALAWVGTRMRKRSASALIQNSLRFRGNGSAYLSRSPGTAGNRRTWTWSGWIKRGSLQQNGFLMAADDGVLYSNCFFSSDYLAFNHVPNTGGTVYRYRTQAVFRDPSAWYHVVFAIDSTQATAANRIRIYVNGTEQTSLVDDTGYGALPQNTDTFINSTVSHMSGRFIRGANNQFDGYLAEVYFVDGQALTPSAFGMVDSITSSWVAKKYTGTYGTNGFYLPFNDGSNLTNLTIDRSGNGNNWTANNISLTAGVNYDWMTDTPTNNYWTLASVNPKPSSMTSQRAGLTTYYDGSIVSQYFYGSQLPTTGKWYFEVQKSDGFYSSSYYGYVGVSVDGSLQAQGVSGSDNRVFLYAIDQDNGKLWWGASLNLSDIAAGTNPSYNFTPGATIVPTMSSGWNWPFYGHWNFGQRPFAYTPPSGFKSLSTANLPTPTILNPKLHFDVALYSGNGSSITVAGMAFRPDLVWSKERNFTYDHGIYDVLRGPTKGIASNSTAAEYTQAESLTSFNADGFSIGNWNGENTNGYTYASWSWKAGGAGVANNDGTVTSTVSANVAAGISIVTYTGTGSAVTVGHGLGVAPKMILLKERTVSGNWPVYHSAIGKDSILILNLTDGSAAVSNYWGTGGVTSTVFGTSPNSAHSNSTANTKVAYCFAEVPGFSKIGSYTGNGSADGPFVWCGFRPRWLMIKSAASNLGRWVIYDTERDKFNLAGARLAANASVEENNISDLGAPSSGIDILSNGFKVRLTGPNHNDSGVTYTFIAIAEAPFKYGNAR